MKLELNLIELNTLYVAVNNQLKQAKEDAKTFPSEFFDREVKTATALVEKVQTALYDECDIVDKAIDTFHYETGLTELDKIQSLESDIEMWEDERNYYASIEDWDRCSHVNSLIESHQEEVNELKESLFKK